MNCEKLHAIAHKGKRFTFNKCDVLQFIPWNGIYLLFENNEIGHVKDRIVRVGINKVDYNLPERLVQHFINPNKDKSIFRKNIGRCFIIQEVDSNHYLEIWNNGGTRDYIFEKELEIRISKYIQNNISFVVIRIDNKEYRLELEKKLISTINNCNYCKPSLKWLGNHSTDPRVNKSGLWQVRGLNGPQVNNRDLEYIAKNILI